MLLYIVTAHVYHSISLSCEKIIYSLVVLYNIYFLFFAVDSMEEEHFTLKQQIEDQSTQLADQSTRLAEQSTQLAQQFAEIQKLKQQVVKLKQTDEDDDETGSPPPRRKKGQILGN